jgi:hypothetical protein
MDSSSGGGRGEVAALRAGLAHSKVGNVEALAFFDAVCACVCVCWLRLSTFSVSCVEGGEGVG